jgi:uncharacterized protein YndB with AHSA1/START domain
MSARAGDAVTAAVLVRRSPARTFELFTGCIDRWWLKGPRYRASGQHAGLIHVEPHLGGRVFESWRDNCGEHAFEVGRITEWCPPERFAFTWRNAAFAAGEVTLVEVDFRASGEATTVTVTHRGWSGIRPDHPARHGEPREVFIRGLGLWWGEQLSSLRLIACE